ncbi:MAG: LysM peptidoglycan-binding domain-containing protein [Bacillota bacterium]
MNNYNARRCLAVAMMAGILGGCAHAPKKAAPAPAPAPATVAAPAPATAAPAMQESAPLRYTVKKGDTLWGIASLYLKTPWAWPDIWYANPAIKNPHLIYPGDVLILGTNAAGQPTLSVERNGQVVTEATPAPAPAPATAAPAAPASSLPVTKLSPQARYLPLNQAVAPIPLDGLRPFLDKTMVVSSGELDKYGYIVTSFNQSPASGANEEVYARNLNNADGARYEIYRLGDKYVDPASGDKLGYEARYIGTAQVETWGDIQKLMITTSVQEAIAGDKLIPATGGSAIDLNFYPHPPAKTVEGDIVSVLAGVGQIGSNDVVVVSRGTDDGVDPGTVLGIYRKGNKATDPNSWFSVTLPTERTGTLMVFRSFKNMSYALVMQATSEIHVADIVGNP